jgi:hypothetical protein
MVCYRCQVYSVYNIIELNDKKVLVLLIHRLIAKLPIGRLGIRHYKVSLIKLDIAFRLEANSQLGLTVETRLARVENFAVVLHLAVK